jgi:hypothetical protein
MRQMKDVLNDLDQLLVKVVNPTTAPFPQLRELADFLIARPGFEDALRQRGIGIIFNSNGAKGQGGGQFLAGNIHLLGGENETPVAFVRLVVHESGHATYQRMILPAHMPVLPNFWDNGTGGELRARLATLQAAADQAGVPLDQSPFATEAATIQATLTAENEAGVWGALSDDAKKLYGAWLTLRANDGQDLLGLNLGAGKSPAERQKYQADNFKEFLAETFMQAMTGTIKAHYDGIQTDPNKSDAVKAAWRDTAEVLDKVAAGQILRVPTVF